MVFNGVEDAGGVALDDLDAQLFVACAQAVNDELVFFDQDGVAHNSRKAEPAQSVEVDFGSTDHIPNPAEACELKNVLVKFFIRLEEGFNVPAFRGSLVHINESLNFGGVRCPVSNGAFEGAGLQSASNEGGFFDLLQRNGSNVATYLGLHGNKPQVNQAGDSFANGGAAHVEPLRDRWFGDGGAGEQTKITNCLGQCLID